jgi:hypothetical protein
MARKRKPRDPNSMRGFNIIGSNDRDIVNTGRAIAAGGASASTVRVEGGQVITEQAGRGGLLPGQRPGPPAPGNLPIKVGAWNVNPATLPTSTSGTGQRTAAATVNSGLADPTGVAIPTMTAWEQATLEGAISNPAEFLMRQEQQFNWFGQQATQRAPENFALKSVANWADKGVHWATRLFDTSDTFVGEGSYATRPKDETNTDQSGVAETAFDGFVQTMNWGLDTLGWGITGTFLAANPHYWANRDTATRTGNLWQDATNVAAGEALQALASPAQDILGQVVTGEQQGIYSIWAEDKGKPFNIADTAMRDEQFRNPDVTTRIDDPIGAILRLGGPLTGPAALMHEGAKAAGLPALESGPIDVNPSSVGAAIGGAAVAGVAEEALTLGAGKFLKWTRVRYVDGLIDSPETAARLVQTVNDDKAILRNNLDVVGDDGVRVNRDIEDMSVDEVNGISVSPVTRFLHQVVARNFDEAGNPVKVTKESDIYNHRAIRWAANRGALARAFNNARTFDEAELIWRHAAGDESAQLALKEMRPDLLRGILNGERGLIRQMLSSNPSLVAAEAAKWEKRHDILLKKIEDMKDADVDPADIAQVRAQADDVAELWRDAANGTVRDVGDGPLVPDPEIDLLRRGIDFELERNDLFIHSLEKANGEASALFGVMRESTAGLGGVGGKSIFGDTALGRTMDMLDARNVNNIGKIVHESRMKRAAAKSASRDGSWGKGVKGWVWDEFTGVYGNPIARVIYWSGNERPSGLIKTAGTSAQESEREIRALLDSVDLYSGEGRTVDRWTKVKRVDENGKPVRDENGKVQWDYEQVQRTVGGQARKDELLRQYTNSLLRGGEEGEVDIKKFLEDLEEEMVKDIADYHGISRADLDEVHYRQNRRLEKIATEIQSEGYWMEDGVKHYAPFLESQIQNSRFMKNWRKIDQIAGRMSVQEKGGLKGVGSKGWEATTEVTNLLNESFQSFWRPAVLLRPGYTVRNVTEGTIRAMAFQYSLMPAFHVIGQLGLSTGNVSGRLFGRTRKAYEVVEMAKKHRDFEKMPERFRKWHDAQQVAVANELHATARVIDAQVEMLATASEPFRLSRISQQTERAFALIDQRDAMRASGAADEGEIEALNARILDIENEVSRLRQMQGAPDELDEFDQRVIDNISYFEETHLPFLEGIQRSLLDPVGSAHAYRKQATANRRLYATRQKEIADYDTMASVMRGKALEDPFSPADPFASIALGNMSADGTQRMAAGLRQQAFSDALKVVENRYYVPVRRGEPTYFDAIATVLNQYQNSDFGRVIIRGRAEGWDDAEIVKQASRWVMEQQSNPVWERSWFADWMKNSMAAMGKGSFEGVADRTARGVKAAEKAVEPLDVGITALKADRAAVRRQVRAAEKDFEARQAASTRELKTYVVDGKRKTRAQMDKMLEDADRRIFEAQEARQATWDANVSVARKDANRFGADTLEDTQEFVAEVLRRYDTVTGSNSELHRYLFSDEQLPMGKAKGQTEAGKIVESFLDRRDADGRHMYELPNEVIGTMAVRVATKTPSEWMHDASQWGFDKFGTIPEDLFVRAPFYGKRFNDTAQTLYDQIVSQVGEDGVTMRHVNMIRNAAHQRALKDTKDWLYTIDRRTNFGDAMENIIPFVSATQNSVTVIGRLIWKDPSILAWVKMAWQAPDWLLKDEDGNPDSIAMPLTLIRNVPGLKQFFDWGNMDDKMHINKTGIDLFTNGIFDPQAQGLIKIPVSELFKHGIMREENPLAVMGVTDNATAQAVWEEFQKFTLGTDDATGEPRGPSERWLSLDMALAPWQQAGLDAFWNNGGTIGSYAKNYARIEMQAQAEYMAGLRDEPTHDEIASKATWMTAARAAMYLMPLLTTPKQVSKYDPLLNAIKSMDSAYADDQRRLDLIDADRVAAGQPKMTMEERAGQALVAPPDQVFGETVTWAFGQGSNRRYTAGLPAIPEAQDFAIGTESYLRETAPRLEKTGRLNLLGMFIQNPDSMYDNTTAAWMMANRIPGTTENFAESMDPSGARMEQRRSAGWVKYMQGADTINSLMLEAGFTHRKQAGAESFDQALDDLVIDIRNDPRYGTDWYSDFDDPNGEKQQEALRVMAGAFDNPEFTEFFNDDPVWGAGGTAAAYMSARQSVVDGLQYLEEQRDAQGIRSWQDADAAGLSAARDQLFAQWQEISATLDKSSPSWATIRQRYIGDDYEPRDIGVRFGG